MDTVPVEEEDPVSAAPAQTADPGPVGTPGTISPQAQAAIDATATTPAGPQNAGPAGTAAGAPAQGDASGVPPAASPGMGSFGTVSPGAQAAVNEGDQDSLTREAMDLQHQKGNLSQDIARDKTEYADDAARAAEAHAKEIEAAQIRGQKWIDDAAAHVADRSKIYEDALNENKSHTVFTGKSTFQKAMAYVGLAMGAVGAGLSAAGGHPTGNTAVQQLNTLMDNDFRDQHQKIMDLKDDVAMSRTGLNDAKTAKEQLTYDLIAKQGAADKVLLANATARLTGLGVSAADLDSQQVIVDLRQRLLDNHKEATQYAQKTYIDNLKAQAERDELEARAGYYASGGARRHTGGGGGGSGAAVDKKAVEFGTWLDAHPDASPSEKQNAAVNDFGIPLKARAGRTSYDTVMADRVRDKKLGQGDERQSFRDVGAWEKDNDVKKVIERQEKLGSILGVLKSAPNNGAAQAAAIEQTVSAARGGAASKQALQLGLDHLGGVYATYDSFLSHLRDGSFGPEKMSKLMEYLGAAQGDSQREGKELYDKFQKFKNSAPPDKQKGIQGEESRIFSGLSGYGSGGSAAPAGDMVTIKNKKGETKQVTRDEARALGAIK